VGVPARPASEAPTGGVPTRGAGTAAQVTGDGEEGKAAKRGAGGDRAGATPALSGEVTLPVLAFLDWLRGPC
jgi:hypothetical protein